MTVEKRCKYIVTPDGTAFARPRPCSRSAKKDGYCKQHHPDAIAERRKARDERYEKAAAARRAPHEQIKRLTAERDALLEFYRAACGLPKKCGHEFPCTCPEDAIRKLNIKTETTP